ncbi:MAG TPA: response regulator, partial [Ktedonobacteraceae bacterium]
VVRSVTPDLILLDYQLPGMNGLECLGLLRASKGMEHIPIVLMSAGFPKQVRERSDLQLLEKPFELDALFYLVQHTLEFKRTI